MAKKPSTIDRFRIICEAEASDMGPIIAQLTRMGLTNVGFELISEVRTFAGNKVHEVKAEDFLAAWVKDNATFRARDAVAHFRANDRTDGACYTAIRMLVANGVLKKLSAGNYTRADIKAIEAPNKKAAATATKKTEHDRTGIEEIARFIRNRKSFTVTQLRELFREQGRNDHSVSPIVDKLLNRKLVKRVGAGEYAPVKRKATAPPKKQPAPPKLNGNGAAHPAMEAAHG